MPYPMKRRAYRPLPYDLTIKKSNIEGLGLFATEKIKKGIQLGVSHYNLMGYSGLGLLRTPLGGFINHSEKPNCKIKVNYMRWMLVTTKNIKPREELTLKYETYTVLKKNTN